MPNFRKYGGLEYAARNNIIRNHISNADYKSVNTAFGQLNSKIVYHSHIDLCGNSLLNINSIYFLDGTIQTTAYVHSPKEPSDMIAILVKEVEELKQRLSLLEKN
jgi:hypothetical protein